MGSPAHRAAALLLVAACTGKFDGSEPFPEGSGSGGAMVAGGGGTGGGAGGTRMGGAGGAGPAAPVCQATADPGPTPLFRLSTLQYRNTVRDLLAMSGVATVADELTEALAAIPDDSTVSFR